MRGISNFSLADPIYESATSLVLRGQRHSDHQPVILKMLKGAHPSPKELARYHHEYTLLRSLDLDTVIKAEGLEEYENTLLLVVEDYGAESLKKLVAAHPLTLAQTLEIMISVAGTLSQLHARHIIHKDINPSNIVYNPQTRVCKLIDFGIATQVSPNSPSSSQRNTLEGTLAYISPEQTGRMNRQVDYRSDLYSLGVTMYELVTGRLPFERQHSTEMVHAHIAGVATPAHLVNPNVPLILSDLITKLMCKTAEQRYQSAAGLAADLQTGLARLRETGNIDTFELGRDDRHDIFYLPQKLYGRERETASLLAAFNQRVLEQGAMTLMLVAGYAGVGKTSLVNEIHKPITQSQGYFIEGKFDQYQRMIPYYAFKRALAGLVDTWLAESETQLAAIAATLQAALGEVGQVMLEIIPALELVIGPQPAVPPLSGVEAQNRLNYVCRNFFRCAASAEHPLIIFIDDLQWADLASLNLMAVLLADPRITHLFFIGAYRDNETTASHPLMLMLESLAQKGVHAESIHVGNLGEEDLVSLCADALRDERERVRGLARLIHTKTLGNPFFATQFLKGLVADGLVTFESARGAWRFDLGEIERRNIPDDVVQLMSAKLQKLAPSSQRLLMLAACIGNAFTLDVLSLIYEKDELETRADLSEAMREGLVIPYDSQVWRFSHDRIQQASYALMENSEQMHLLIGRSLLQNAGDKVTSERLFEIVNQLNAARRLISDETERWRLAQLNLDAAGKAKNAAAFTSALRYLTAAAELLPAEAWHQHYDLTFAIHTEMAWCLFYAGETEPIEAVFAKLLTEARDIQDRVRVQMIRSEHYHLQGKYAQAVEIQKESLQLLGVPVDGEARATLLTRELEAVAKNLEGRSIEDLEHAPRMESPTQQAIMDILMRLWTSAYLNAQIELVAWSSCKMTNLSLEYGNNHLTAYGYMNYAYVCVGMLGQYETGHRIGQVAIRLAEKFDDLLIRGKVYLLFAVFVNHWRAPLITSLEYSLKAFPLLVENGDWTYAGYCAEFIISDPTIGGVACDKLLQDTKRYLPFLQDNAPVVLDEFFRPACLNPLLHLLGRTDNDGTFDDAQFSEAKFLDDYKNNPLALSYFYTVKLRALYWFGHLDEALALFDKAEFVAQVALAQAKVPEMYFFASLTALAAFDTLTPAQREYYIGIIAGYQDKMKVWAENSPANFLHKYLLVEAERARCASQDWRALELYQAAIQEAKQAGYRNHEGLAQECVARFFLAHQLPRLAAHAINEARYAYRKWGAKAKVEQITRCYGDLLSIAGTDASRAHSSLTQTTTQTAQEVNSTTDSLDLLAIVEASQSIAGEIKLDQLLTKLMKIVTENAGADRAVLLTLHEGRWNIRAEAKPAWEKVCISEEGAGNSAHADALPLSLLNYCARKKESVVLGDAASQGLFVKDVYLASTSMQSVLCVPLLHSGTIKGVLYLENSLVQAAFTQEHLKVIELLSTQIAISVENAEFYRGLEQLVEQRTAELARVNQELMQANRKLEGLTRIDGLTQIPNRRAFDQILEVEWRRHQRMQYDFALILCDIDHFKKFNDTYGHLVGDECLRRVAQVINQATRRPGDLAARYGGEEFVIVLSETNLEGAQNVVQMIQDHITRLEIPGVDSDTPLRVTLSFGVLHLVPQHEQEAKAAVHAADLALYQAKAQGRNCVVVSEEIASDS